MTERKYSENKSFKNVGRLGLGLLLGIAGLHSSAAYSQQATDPVAEIMLLCQRDNGGWSKALNGKAIVYTAPFSDSQIADIKSQHAKKDATIDNNATTKEINYLLKTYQKTHHAAYLAAAEKGLDYLLEAQYDNGGWPQYYPDSSLYRSQVTFNDNAIINVMILLNNVAKHTAQFEAVDPKYIPPATTAVKKGIDCILKTQIIVDGKKTAWNQQYNKTTLQPEMARAFELVGLATSESVAIVKFLMEQPHPSEEVKDAINSAMAWFKEVAIHDYATKVIPAPNEVKGKDVLLVKSPGATIWARFYEIGTNRPFFSGRNSEKKYDLKEIENERRAGYKWYGNWPEQLLRKDYANWLKKNSHS